MSDETQELDQSAQAGAADTSQAGAAQSAGAEASNGASDGDKPDGAGGAGQKQAASPAAQGKTDDGKPKSSFEAIQRVYQDGLKKAEKAAGKAEGDGGSPDPDASGAPKDGAEGAQKAPDEPPEKLLNEKIPDEEWKALKPKTRARIQVFRSRIKELDGAIRSLNPKAQAHEQTVRYMQQNGLNAETANQGLALMAAILQDPERAARALAPLNEYVQRQLGEVMPDDIRARVDQGEISEQAGKELARARAMNERAGAREQARTESERQSREAETQRTALTNRAAQVQQAIGTWEQDWKKGDPDYSKKAPHVIKRITRALQAKAEAGIIPTPEQAIALVKEIRTEVEADFKELAPRPQPSRVVTGGTTTPAGAPPKSSFDAVRLAYNEGRRSAA